MNNTNLHLLSCVLTLLILALSACSPDSTSQIDVEDEWVRHSEWSDATFFSKWDDVARRGQLVGFVRPEDRTTHPYERPSNDLFVIDSGDDFKTLLILYTGSDYEQPSPVLVSVFVDYEQEPFALDGKSGLLHYLEIEPNVNMEIPLEVPLRGDGWHDLFVVVFPEPEVQPVNPSSRAPPSFSVAGYRTVVCVQNCEKRPEPFSEPIIGEVREPTRTLSTRAFPLEMDDGDLFERIIWTTSIEAGEPLPLELWAQNPTDSPRDYVVLPLLNYRQFQYNGDGMSDRMRFRMPPGSERFVQGRIEGLPQGIHELQFVTLHDPYTAIDQVGDPFITSHLRSGIIVESQ